MRSRTSRIRELTLTIDLTGYENVVLSFWAREFRDELRVPPSGPFTDAAIATLGLS